MGLETLDIKAGNTQTLEPGMCFSIVYIDGELEPVGNCAAGLDSQEIMLASGLPKDTQVIPFLNHVPCRCSACPIYVR